MGYENHGYALFLVQRVDSVHYLAAALGVKHCGRLVHDYALRLHGDDSGNGNALLLSAGQLVRRMLAVLIHIHLLQGFVYPPAYFRLRDSHILRGERHVLLDDCRDKLVVRILEHHSDSLPDIEQPLLVGGVDTCHRHLSGGGGEYCIEMLCQRGFSAAVMSQYRQELSLRNGKAYVLQHRAAAYFLAVLIAADIVKGYVFDFYNIQVNSPVILKNELSPCFLPGAPFRSALPEALSPGNPR